MLRRALTIAFVLLSPWQGSFASPGTTQAADDDVPALSYGWKAGREYQYETTMEAEIGDTKQRTLGEISFKLVPAEDTVKSLARKPETGTGTAFVVHPNGGLLTCAHVVKDASKVEVALGGKTYTAKVFALDKSHDLAILKIDARGLPTLPLGDSETVQQAEEVRAVGYPLSDLLGNTVKVTRGTIAGVAMDDHKKRFQMDASINPGNSGGPLVNERGEVVAIPSAGLFGMVSNVGFSIPINYARELLAAHHIPIQTAQNPPKLEGPALARAVTPAVALVTVTIDPELSGGKRYRLDYSGHFTVFTHAKNESALTGTPASSQSDRCRLVVDELGKIVSVEGEGQSGGFHERIVETILATLPPPGKAKWKSEEETQISEATENSSLLQGRSYGRPPSYRPGYTPPRSTPPGLRPRPGTPRYATPGSRGSAGSEPSNVSVKVYPALERVDFSLDEVTAETVAIKRDYHFATQEKTAGPPHLEVSGAGAIVFDRKVGLPKNGNFQGTINYSLANVTLRIPFKVTVNPLDPAKAAARAKAAKEAADAAKASIEAAMSAARARSRLGPAAGAPAIAGMPFTPPHAPAESTAAGEANLDELLGTLRSKQSDWSHRYLALGKLARMTPDAARRAEVADLLDPLLTDLNSSLRTTATTAVGVWGTKQNLPTLLKLVEHNDLGVRWPVIEALAKLQFPEAAEKLAERIADTQDGLTAARACETMGAVAEDAVIKILKHPDVQTRYRACNVLGKIGGRKSIVALNALLKTDREGWSRAAAGIALRQLLAKAKDAK